MDELAEERMLEAEDAQAEIPEEGEALERALIEAAARLLVEQLTGQAGEVENPRCALARELARQEADIRAEQPDFDLEKCLCESAAFRALIEAGEPVERALDYVEPERAERRVLERIRRRNLRPETMGVAQRPRDGGARERMGEEEIRRIDAQLKRGLKVHLN